MAEEHINAYMDKHEREKWFRGDVVQIGEYEIRPKRDFGRNGFYDAATRSSINMGWVIVKGPTNATPGAGWFHTIGEAVVGLNLLVVSKGDADMYHALWAAMKGMIAVVNDKKEASLKARKALGLPD